MALNYVGVKGMRVERLNVDGQFGLVDVLLKSNRRKDLDIKQLNESLMEETAKPVIEGQDAEKAKQLFDQRERLL